MSGKLYKALRKMVDFIPSLPRQYKHTTVKTVMVGTGVLDAEGKEMLSPSVRSTFTALGDRAHYQALKKAYKAL